MRTTTLLIFLCQCLFCIAQNTFTYPEGNDPRPQFSLDYSDTWLVDQKTENTLFLKIEDPQVSTIGLKLNISGKVYDYLSSGSSMENIAQVLFSHPSTTIDTILISGKKGYVLTSKNTYRNEERILKDIFVDFIQYSTFSIHISGSTSMFQKYQQEIDKLISSINFKEVRIIPPIIEISESDFNQGINSQFQYYISEVILNNLYNKSKVIIGDHTEFEYLSDFFHWKRQSKDSLSRFEANDLLLYMNWLEFSKVDIDLQNSSLQLRFFRNDKNILTLETVVKDPVLLEQIGICEIETFYIDYRPRQVLIEGKFLIDEKTGGVVESPFMLLNGEVFPLNYTELIWY